MTVLLSIKPEFVAKIFNGTKKYEYRKILFKKEGVKKIIVYSSSPVQKVIGEFDIAEILCDSKEEVWQATKSFSGISKQFFNDYFAKKETAIAIKIGKTTKYDKPKTLCDFDIDFAPQSFVYV